MKNIGLLLSLLLLLVGCKGSNEENTRVLFVGITPYEFAVKSLVGDSYAVETLIKEGQNAHSFSPTPKQIHRLSKATIYFSSGLEFEKSLIPRIKKLNPKVKIIDLSSVVKKRFLDPSSHGASCSEHNHSGDDPHIWLSPRLFEKQVETMATALIKSDSTLKESVEANLQGFKHANDSLIGTLQKQLAPLSGGTIYVYHPAFGYFTDEFNLIQKAIETGGKEPSAKELQRLVGEIKEHKVSVLFVQKQYSKKSAEVIAKEANCRVVPINPMPSDYFSDLQSLGTTIATELNR